MLSKPLDEWYDNLMKCDKCSKEIQTGEKFNLKPDKMNMYANINLCEQCTENKGEKTNAYAGGVVKSQTSDISTLLLDNSKLPKGFTLNILN